MKVLTNNFSVKGVMVRLMLVLAPIMCVVGGIGVSSVLSLYMRNYIDHNSKQSSAKSASSKKYSSYNDSSYPAKSEVAAGVIGCLTLFLAMYAMHCVWVTSEAYSSPSIVLGAKGGDGNRIIFDDFREAYRWLAKNTAEVSVDCF